MADNFLGDAKISSPGRKDEFKYKSFDSSGDCLNWELKSDNGYRKEIREMMSQFHENHDLLPSDPFNMDTIVECTVECTMIIGCIEEVDEDKSEMKKAMDDGLLIFDGSKESSHGKVLNSSNEEDKNCRDDDGGAPSDGFIYVLGYLCVRELLSVEGVCKDLQDGVRNDPLLWRSIHIDEPLNAKITDETLLSLTSRAGGSLRCLSLVKCWKITDDGIKNVVQRNPGLTMLSVPSCIRLSWEGLLGNIKALKSTCGAGIKLLRIGGMHVPTVDQFEELKYALSVDNQKQLTSHKPRFYNGDQSYLTFDDDRAIDIEKCPKCHKLRQVYDCPSESCQGKHNGCRACILCIGRCFNCGCCFKERQYIETFCLNFLCLDCLMNYLNVPKQHGGGYEHSFEAIYFQSTGK